MATRDLQEFTNNAFGTIRTVEPYMSEPSTGMLTVHDAVEEARNSSSVAWADHQVAEAADLWNVAVNTIASHYNSENAESMLSLLHLVIMDINELACRVAVPVDAPVEVGMDSRVLSLIAM